MGETLPSSAEVVVVGGGNAALCAALAAVEQGASVLVLERAPESEAGGNSRFTAGAFRCVYDGVDDLRALMPDLTDDEAANSDFGAYTEEKFFDDMGRITEYRTDPDLCEVLIKRSRDTLLWMRDKGVRFAPIWGRQAYRIGGKFKFWGGLTVEASGGGPGLVEALTRIARKDGVAIAYGARALSLIADDDGVKGVRAKHNGRTVEVKAKAVVLAAGGFQANAEMRTRYLGPLWELAKVRGTRFNTGDGIRMALEIGAMPTGNWSGCPRGRLGPQRAGIRRPLGRRQFPEAFLPARRHDQRLGRALRRRGRRFPQLHLRQIRPHDPDAARPVRLASVRPQSDPDAARRIPHQTGDESARRHAGGTGEQARRRRCGQGAGDDQGLQQGGHDRSPLRPEREGRTRDPRTRVPKSNWANTIDEPPFEAYAVTCGITFTFGGLKIDPSARVIDAEGAPIPGLFAAGELVGGIFYFNYPGGTGLMNGAVFGRIAGASAGRRAEECR